MSNKIDQLFKRTLEKEQFEYKAAYFEALERQGLPMKRSFISRNKQFLLFAIPLLFVGTATMAYYFAQNASSKNDALALKESGNSTQLTTTAQKLEGARGQELAYHSPNATPAPAAAIRQSRSSASPEPNTPQQNVQSALQPDPETGDVYTNKESLRQNSGSTPDGADGTKNSPRETVNTKDISESNLAPSNSMADLAESQRSSKETSTSSSTSKGASLTKPVSSENNSEIHKQNETSLGIAASSKSKAELPIVEKNTFFGSSKHTASSSAAEAESAASHFYAVGQSIRNLADASNEKNTLSSHSSKAGIALDSLNICLVDGNSLSPFSSAASDAFMVHPKGRKNSSWYIGLNTQYNFFSKTPIDEGPYKKYMRMRIEGESLNNNVSYGLYAKRVGRMLTYSAGFNVGVVSENIGYIGQKNIYTIDTTYVNLGDTLNASPGSPRPTLLNMRMVVDSTLEGKVDTAFQKRTNSLSYFEIPLSLGYHHQIGRMSAEIQGGINLMYAYKMDGYYLHESREYMSPVGEHLSRFSVSPMLGLELNYQLNSHWMIGSRFTYRMPNARFSPDERFTWKQSSLGVNLAYRIR